MQRFFALLLYVWLRRLLRCSVFFFFFFFNDAATTEIYTLSLHDALPIYRAGHEMNYYPGNTALRIADVAIINKIGSADPKNVNIVRDNIRNVNPKAQIIEAAS